MLNIFLMCSLVFYFEIVDKLFIDAIVETFLCALTSMCFCEYDVVMVHRYKMILTVAVDCD